ncbi:MAG: hypothetical protein JEZ07_13360 [Phycisphaerae bacterium]|nr:hypothetical protein [Phycisphaerae bacterium]
MNINAMYNELFENYIEIKPDDDLATVTLAIPAGAGVCLFVADNDKPVVFIYAASLRNLARRRLDQQQARKADLRSIIVKIYFCSCFSQFETQLQYFKLARKIYPDSYTELMPRLDVWFLKLDNKKSVPSFSISRNYQNDCCWGPFPTKGPIGQLIEIVQQLFGLCRNPARLKSCSYGQMGLCVGLCLDKISDDEYAKLFQKAIDFLNDNPQHNIEYINEHITQLSKELKFEQAGQMHQKLKALRKIYDMCYVGPVEKFWIIAFQPGPKITIARNEETKTARHKANSISTFIIGPGVIEQLAPFTLNHADENCKAVLDHLNLCKLQQNVAKTDEQLLGWLTNQLHKNDSDKGLFVVADEDLNTKTLAEKVNDYFQS